MAKGGRILWPVEIAIVMWAPSTSTAVSAQSTFPKR